MSAQPGFISFLFSKPLAFAPITALLLAGFPLFVVGVVKYARGNSYISQYRIGETCIYYCPNEVGVCCGHHINYGTETITERNGSFIAMFVIGFLMMIVAIATILYLRIVVWKRVTQQGHVAQVPMEYDTGKADPVAMGIQAPVLLSQSVAPPVYQPPAMASAALPTQAPALNSASFCTFCGSQKYGKYCGSCAK